MFITCVFCVTGSGGFTNTDPEKRRVVPDAVAGRVRVKVVYVVLEAQYQAAVTKAVQNINAKNTKVGSTSGRKSPCLILSVQFAIYSLRRSELRAFGQPAPYLGLPTTEL